MRNIVPLASVTSGGLLLLSAVLATPAAAHQPASSCSVTRVLPIDATGELTRTADEVDGVLVDTVGTVPIDLSETLEAVVAEATGTTSPLVVEVVRSAGGAQSEVTGVTGPLPTSLSASIADALGCSDEAEPAPSGDGNEESGESEESGEDAPTECSITSVAPLEGTVEDVEGVVVDLTGPLPVDLSDTVAEVAGQLDEATGPVAVTLVETVAGVEAEVTGITGPLPVALAPELANALGCRDETAPPTDGAPSDEPSEPTDDEPAGDGATDEGQRDETTTDDPSARDTGTDDEGSSDQNAAVLSSQNSASGAVAAPGSGELPRTGGGAGLSLAGVLSVGLGLALRRWTS